MWGFIIFVKVWCITLSQYAYVYHLLLVLIMLAKTKANIDSKAVCLLLLIMALVAGFFAESYVRNKKSQVYFFVKLMLRSDLFCKKNEKVLFWYFIPL